MTTTNAAPSIPTEFICPITMELMVYPMATRHGPYNFERDAIISWLARGNRHCPLTRTPLKIGDLIHNNYLTAQIQVWCQQHGVEQAVRDEDTSNESIREQLWCDDYLKHTYGTVEPRFKAVTLASYCFDGTESTCQRHKHGIRARWTIRRWLGERSRSKGAGPVAA